jgi:hypothetical protein
MELTMRFLFPAPRRSSDSRGVLFAHVAETGGSKFVAFSIQKATVSNHSGKNLLTVSA